MNVTKLSLHGFMSHVETEIELPNNGVVLVTGPNGSGKSSIVEAVSWALWGKTLRGTPPWPAGSKAAAAVDLLSDSASVFRQRKSRTDLKWVVPGNGEAPTNWESTTHAQKALDRVIGAHDVWRRTSVFSSQDAAHFTLAPDRERKRLLESILGLDQFDTALDRCRADLKMATQCMATRVQRVAVLDERVSGARTVLERAEGDLQALGPAPHQTPEKTGADRSTLDVQNSKALALIRDLRADLRKAETTGQQEQADLRAARAQLQRLDHDDCPVCGQMIPQDLVSVLRSSVEDAEKAAEAISIVAGDCTAGIQEELADMEALSEDLRRKVYEATITQKTAEAEFAARERAKRSAATASATLDEAEGMLDTARTDLISIEAETSVLKACEQVLGLRGVRAHVLGRALSGVEQVANVWLHRIAGGQYSLTLKSYTEKKTGGVTDAISLEIAGAGGGHGYKATSGGQRRRIDVALLLALADVASAAHGQHAGTLFFDEVADSLDIAGQEAFAEALSDISESRCVVVISHSEDLVGLLRPRVHYKLHDGGVAHLRMGSN